MNVPQKFNLWGNWREPSGQVTESRRPKVGFAWERSCPSLGSPDWSSLRYLLQPRSGITPVPLLAWPVLSYPHWWTFLLLSQKFKVRISLIWQILSGKECSKPMKKLNTMQVWSTAVSKPCLPSRNCYSLQTGLQKLEGGTVVKIKDLCKKFLVSSVVY